MGVLCTWYMFLNFSCKSQLMDKNAMKQIMKFLMQDFSKEYMDDLGHGIYTPMDISLLPPLYLIYAENPSDSGKVSFELNFPS